MCQKIRVVIKARKASFYKGDSRAESIGDRDFEDTGGLSSI